MRAFDVCGSVHSVWVCERVYLCALSGCISINMLMLLYLQIIRFCLMFCARMSSMAYESVTGKSH